MWMTRPVSARLLRPADRRAPASRRPVDRYLGQRTHPLDARDHRFAAEHGCRTLVALPKYAAEIDPTEGIWSLIKRGLLANLVPVGLDELAGTVRFALKRIQYQIGRA